MNNFYYICFPLFIFLINNFNCSNLIISNMESIIKTPSFQKFLSVHDQHNDKSWDEVKEKVTKYYQKNNGNDEKFLKLCLGLAKYDLHGAPSNWDDRFNHEKTIFEWAKYVSKNK